jgi:hypothetical protein
MSQGSRDTLIESASTAAPIGERMETILSKTRWSSDRSSALWFSFVCNRSVDEVIHCCAVLGRGRTSESMRLRRDRSGVLMPTLGIALLATLLLVALGWAVVGKHRLDPHARHVYKSTRLVVAEKQEQPAPPAVCRVPCTDAPAPFELVLPARSPSPDLPPRRDPGRASRAPPTA